MLNAMRTALLTHKAILISNMEKQRESSSSSSSSSSSLSEYEDVLTSETVFWMATQGGAEALNLGNEVSYRFYCIDIHCVYYIRRVG